MRKLEAIVFLDKKEIREGAAEAQLKGVQWGHGETRERETILRRSA